MAKSVDLLVERLKSDASDYKGDNARSHGLLSYLQELIDDGNLLENAAVGSAKQAIDRGILSLTDLQLQAIALEMLKNQVYMSKCPNEWCEESISWSDMTKAINDGQCCHCDYVEDKHERE